MTKKKIEGMRVEYALIADMFGKPLLRLACSVCGKVFSQKPPAFQQIRPICRDGRCRYRFYNNIDRNLWHNKTAAPGHAPFCCPHCGTMRTQRVPRSKDHAPVWKDRGTVDCPAKNR